MVSRRRFIQTIVVGGVAGLAGCGTPPGPPNGEPPTETETPKGEFAGEFTKIQPDGIPDNRPSLTACNQKSLTNHPILVNLGEVQTGDSGPWQLRITDTELDIGETFAIQLLNTSDSVQTTNPKEQYNFQAYTDRGWSEIRWMKEQVEYSEESVEIQPGEGYIWAFYTTEEGLVAGHPQGDKLTICPEVQEGRYRFIFSEPSIAVHFNITV